MINAIVPAVLIAAAIFIIFFGVSRFQSQTRMTDRLERFVGRDGEKKTKQLDRKASAGVITVKLDKAIAKRSFAGNIARDLARADLKLTVSEFLASKFISILCFIAIGTMVGRNLGAFSAFVGLVFGVVGFLAPDWYVKIRQMRRMRAFNNQLGDTITLMSNSLRSGYSMLQSMEMIAHESPPPACDEFKRVVREVGLGLSSQEAMNNLLRRMPSEDLDLMITGINIQHEVGGNLAQILEGLAHTIRERVRIRGEIRSLTAMQSGSGYIISGLPVGLAALLLLMAPAYVLKLFAWPWICMPIGSGLMILVGFLFIRKIVRIDI